jgi:rsbT antagonist protein RsbS
MSEVTILRMGETIIVPVQMELHDKAALGLQHDILMEIEKAGAKAVIIDVSAISIVDSFLGRLLVETARMARLMGAETILVGLRKEVVITLIQLGFVISGMRTALNMEEGLELLRSLQAGRTEPEAEG